MLGGDEMAILEKEVEVTLAGGTILKHVESLGYNVPRKGKHVPRGTKVTVKIDDLPKGSQTKVTKICDDCGEKTKSVSYAEIIYGRINGDGKDRCFKCGKIKSNITKQNKLKHKKSLEFYAKENNLEYLLSEYSDKNGIDISKVSYGSNNNFWWNCPDCKSEYDMQMIKRTTRNFNCPYCKGRRVNETNSLADFSQKISSEWNYKLNELTPKEIYKFSTKKYWWKCPKCKSDYMSSPYHRKNNINCPYCAGQKVNDTNNLSVKNPSLASEWNYARNFNLTPEQVTSGSTKKVWWVCKYGHEWETTISHRNVEGNGCPICLESKGEKKIRAYLENNKIDFIPQKMFKGLKGLGGGNLSYDFYLPKMNMLIEYQGKQHEEFTVGIHKAMHDFKKQESHDRRKREYAKKHNLFLLEIWYFQFETVEEILDGYALLKGGISY